MVIFVMSSPEFSMNFRDNSKNKNCKFDFSFVSTHCASSIKTGSKLRGGGGCISLVGKYPVRFGYARLGLVRLSLDWLVFLIK